ncbi:MAG: ATP-binding protein [Acidobacteriota bacterium]
MTISPSGYAFIGLTAIVACLVSVLMFALLRFAAAARDGTATRDDAGHGALMSAALEEALARLKAQERATAARADASERLSEEIIFSLTAGLLVVGLHGEIRILNPAGRRLLEWGEDGADAQMPSAREQPLVDVIAECLEDGRAILRRSVRLPAIGRGVDLGVTVSPLFDGQKQLHGAICLFTDLTAVREMEERLRMKEGLATVGELTAGIAHEFRNGLATIYGYSQLLDLGTLPAAYRPFVEAIRAETTALSQVVTNFLSFAKPAQLALADVDLTALLGRAVEEVRADARALGGDVEMVGTFCTVEGDDVLLRQAFSNLLRNALEACVGANVVPRVAVVGEVDPAQQVVRVTVNDNGPGIAHADRERVFQPFFTSKGSGTGLGLSLVQKIVVFHNGRVVAGTSADGGASLQVTLPVGKH